jgi:hypothetical protein
MYILSVLAQLGNANFYRTGNISTSVQGNVMIKDYLTV